MKKPRETKQSSDEAVKAKTGRIWAEWFKILDKVGAKDWPHKEISVFLHEKQNVPSWWAQMVCGRLRARARDSAEIPEMRWPVQRVWEPHPGSAPSEGVCRLDG